MAEDFMRDADDLERRMEGSVSALRTELASLRTRRALASMLTGEGTFTKVSDQGLRDG